MHKANACRTRRLAFAAHLLRNRPNTKTKFPKEQAIISYMKGLGKGYEDNLQNALAVAHGPFVAFSNLRQQTEVYPPSAQSAAPSFWKSIGRLIAL